MDHPSPYSVAGSFLFSWAKAETSGVLRYGVKATDRKGSEADIEAMRERRKRWGEMYAEGVIDRDEYDRRRSDVEAELTRLTGAQQGSLVFRLGFDWRASPAELNHRLRGLWSRVVLGPDMRPVGAVWKVEPEGWDDAERVEDGWYLPTKGGYASDEDR